MHLPGSQPAALQASSSVARQKPFTRKLQFFGVSSAFSPPPAVEPPPAAELAGALEPLELSGAGALEAGAALATAGEAASGDFDPEHPKALTAANKAPAATTEMKRANEGNGFRVRLMVGRHLIIFWDIRTTSFRARHRPDAIIATEREQKLLAFSRIPGWRTPQRCKSMASPIFS